jgi:hypothetical protein
MRTTLLHAATAAAALLVAGAVHAQAQPSPAQKGKSAQSKPATTTARGGYDIKKGTSVSRKKPDASAGSTTKPRQGLEANGTSAQGISHE